MLDSTKTQEQETESMKSVTPQTFPVFKETDCFQLQRVMMSLSSEQSKLFSIIINCYSHTPQPMIFLFSYKQCLKK